MRISEHGMRIATALSVTLSVAALASAQTQNYVAKFNASSNPIDSQMFDNGVNVGIGTSSPVTKLMLQTSATNDGIRIHQNGSTAAALGLFNNGAGGHWWALFSTGGSNGQGAGNFSIYDYTAALDRLFITGGGDVGLGTTLPGAKLHVSDLNYNGPAATPRYGAKVDLSSSAVYDLVGVRSGVTNSWTSPGNPTLAIGFQTYVSAASANIGAQSVGVDATASGATNNFGGRFIGQDGYANYGVQSAAYVSLNSGVAIGGQFTADSTVAGSPSTGVFTSATAPAGGASYGIEADATGGLQCWAGWFDGQIHVNKVIAGSDSNLKRNVRSLEGSLERIKRLRPRKYEFRTDEYPEFRLPEGSQFGFVAQELEQVLPELVVDCLAPNHAGKPGDSTRESRTFKGVDYTGVIPVLVGAMQEQQEIIESQGKDIAELKARLEALERLVRESARR